MRAALARVLARCGRLGRWLARRLAAPAAKVEPRAAVLAQPSIDLPSRTSPARRAASMPTQPKPKPQPKPAPRPAPKAAPRRLDTLEPALGPAPAPAARPSPPRRARGGAGLVSREVRVEDTSIHSVERPAAGAAPAATVILIHGAGLDHRDWTFRFIAELPPELRVFAFDRPGFGRSGRPRGPASALPATQARLLRAAARTLGVERSVLVGHSWGGAVVMAWALDAPESVQGVLAIAGAVAPWSFQTAMANGRRMQSAARLAMGAGGLRAAAIEALAESFAPNPTPEGYVEHVKTELNPMSGPAAATLADISTINGALALLAPRYGGLVPPVELIYGEEDGILPPDEQAAAARALPAARMTRLPGVGHMVHHSAPTPCRAALARLVAAG